jgi:hypothetical protein
MPKLPLPFVALVAITFALAGCGGGSSDALHAVATATKATMSQTLVSDLTLHGAKLLGTVRETVVGRGAFAFDTGIGYERIDLPGEAVQGVGPREYLDLLPTKLYFERATATGSVVLYNGKGWVAPAIAGPVSVDALVPRFVLQVQALSPQLLLDELEWGAVAATHIGSPVVNHVPQAKYRVSVDLKQALAKATGVTQTAIKDELAANGSSTVSMLVWVDGPGHIVDLQQAVPGAGLGTVSMALSNFGVKIPGSLPTDDMLLHITAQTPSGADLLRSVWIF